MNNNEFTHLHIHNEYSLLDGLGTAEEYCQKANELGFLALGLTNHGNVDGVIKFQKACKNNHLMPVFGCEAYIVPNLMSKKKGEKRGHVVLFVKNKIGWRNLLNMLTIANLKGFYSRPRIDFDLLLNYCEGLVITTACQSSFITLNSGIDFLSKLHKKIKDDLYLEVMPLNMHEQREHNKLVLEINRKFNIPIIASNDCHYVHYGDSILQEVVLAIRNKKKWNDKSRWKFSVDDLFLKSADEMISSFKKQKVIPFKTILQALKNTNDIVKKCANFNIPKQEFNLPKIEECKDKDEITFFRQLLTNGLANIDSSNYELYAARAKSEADAIISNNFVRYFLIVWELISWCNKNNIAVGPGRGSVGGCLVAYLLGITKIDPIKHKLLFERFISPGRLDLPDIDIDFEDIKRSAIIQHLEDKYGKGHIANVTTFLRMKDRLVLRDVARVFDVPQKDTDEVTKYIDDIASITLDKVIKNTEIGTQYSKKYPMVIDIAMRLKGQVRGYGKHAAAVIISNDALEGSSRTYLAIRNNDIVENWDKEDAEYMGMLKLDVLGLKAITILKETQRLVHNNHGINIVFEDIALDDKDILHQFALGNSTGCFQFGTYGLKQLCTELKINSFDLLATATALYRPAPLRSGLTEEFIKRKNGKIYDRISYKVHNILKDVYGTIVFQEQTILIANLIAGFSIKEADRLRKILDKEDKIEKAHEHFINGCINNGLKEEKAKKLWKRLSSYGGYGFNKSHAYAYTMISYWDMYCKYNYPAEFICASLTYGTKEIKNNLIYEAFDYNINIAFPKIGKSKATTWSTDGKTLFMPFIEIKYIGDKYAAKIEQLTKGKKWFMMNDEDNPFKGRILQLLTDIKAFSPNEIPEYIDNKLSFDFPKIIFEKMKRNGGRHVNV